MNCYTKCYASFVSMFLLFVVMQSPSLGFDFSKNYAKTLPNPTTAGVGGITQAKLYKCDSEGCQTIKEKIKPINDNDQLLSVNTHMRRLKIFLMLNI